MFGGARDRLLPGGALYVVIRKQQGAPSARRHLETLFPAVQVIARGAGYHIIEARMP